MSRAIVAAVSDTHGGHKYGLLSPDVVLYDDTNEGDRIPYTPQSTAEQQYLFELYETCINKCVELAGPDPIYLIHNGDATHGLKHKDELVSTRMSDQIFIAQANMRRWLLFPNVQTAAITVGTSAHNMGEGSSEILIGDALQKEYPEKKIMTMYHGLWDINGYTIDFSHHGPTPGWRDWTRGNQARFYARDLMIRALNYGIDPPDLILRSHHHDIVSETVEIRRGDKFYTSKIVVTPPFCMLGDYGRQAVKSPFMITDGMVAFEIVDDHLHEMHTLLSSSDIRTKMSFIN